MFEPGDLIDVTSTIHPGFVADGGQFIVLEIWKPGDGVGEDHVVYAKMWPNDGRSEWYSEAASKCVPLGRKVDAARLAEVKRDLEWKL